MSLITVERLRADDQAEAAGVLSRAFLTQPNNVAIWRRQDEPTRRRIEKLFRIAKLERPVSNAWVARRDGKIVGALNMAESPRCQLGPLETVQLLMRILPVFPGALLRMKKLQSAWAKHDPRERHWHLGPIGVAPHAQDQRVGSRMLEACCAMIAERNDAAYLEADRPENVPFYERFGFRVTAEETILGVHNWFMWRAPR